MRSIEVVVEETMMGITAAAETVAADVVITEDGDGGDDAEEKNTDGGEMGIVAATGDLEERLKKFQKEFTEAMLGAYDSRLQDPEVAKHLRMIFDFRRMPLQDNPAAQAQLQSWSNEDIDWVVKEKFPELDVTMLKNQALAARMFVKANKERFMQLVDNSDPSKGKVLVLTGEGSIFEELFSRSDVCTQPIPLFLHVADYMISFMWQSCNAERAGSHMNRTKTLERTGLHDDIFDSLMFCTFNMPFLHEIDFDLMMEAWEKAGHKSGTFKGIDGDSLDSSSKVIKRQLEKKSSTFLFKTNHE